MFPWETGWDKRTLRASLPGADIVGFQRKAAPRFIFGQVKSSSENRVPPQIVSSGDDCLKAQMYRLDHNDIERMPLIQWLLLRVKGTAWEATFKEALEKYAQKDYFLVGMLISGGRAVNAKDMTSICKDIQHDKTTGELSLFSYYIPYDKESWVDLVHGQEVAS